MDKLSSMRTYRRVVELGSFRAAATDRGLSNAGVSKQIIELEAELGASLITRTTRKLTITQAGQPTSSDVCRFSMTLPRPRPRLPPVKLRHPASSPRLHLASQALDYEAAPLWRRHQLKICAVPKISAPATVTGISYGVSPTIIAPVTNSASPTAPINNGRAQLWPRAPASSAKTDVGTAKPTIHR